MWRRRRRSHLLKPPSTGRHSSRRKWTRKTAIRRLSGAESSLASSCRRSGWAESPAADVEVEVVVVEFVAVGGEHDVEIIAGALGHGVQKVALGAGRPPILLDGHALAALHQEPRDIDRAAGDVLAPAPGHALNPPARVSAQMIEPDDVGCEIAPGERLGG